MRVFGPKSFGTIPARKLLGCGHEERVKLKGLASSNAIESEVLLKGKFQGAQYISLIDIFCDGTYYCNLYDGNRLLSFDGDHLTRNGAGYLGGKFE